MHLKRRRWPTDEIDGAGDPPAGSIAPAGLGAPKGIRLTGVGAADPEHGCAPAAESHRVHQPARTTGRQGHGRKRRVPQTPGQSSRLAAGSPRRYPVPVILTRHFVFLHLPKTGGSFVRRVMERAGPADWEAIIHPMHPTHGDIPDTHRKLPVLGAIRNPWTWYVSWFRFLKKGGPDRPHNFFEEISKGGTRDFAATIHAALDHPLIADSATGGLDWYLRWTFGPQLETTRFCRMEHLRKDLGRHLESLLGPLPEPFAATLAGLPEQNVQPTADVMDFYDDALIERIRRLDAPVFARFGYPTQPR